MSHALFAAPALALLLSAGVIALLRRSASSLPADVPNPRSLHGAPVPRAGGPFRCCFGTTARKARGCTRGVALPMVSRVWHNGSQLLARVEKVPMAGAKGGFLAKFFR